MCAVNIYHKYFHGNSLFVSFAGILEKERTHFVELPYGDRTLSMVIFLPVDETPTALDDLLQRFSDETVSKSLNEGSILEVELEMPRMSFGGECE